MARRAAVALAGLGEVQLEGARPAVGDGDGEVGLGDRQGHLELGARVQDGVLAQLARQQNGGIDEVGVDGGVDGGGVDGSALAERVARFLQLA